MTPNFGKIPRETPEKSPKYFLLKIKCVGNAFSRNSKKKNKKKIGRRTQSRRSAKIIIKTVFWKKTNYFVLEIFVKKIRRPTKKCNNCRKLFGGGSENLKIKLVWPKALYKYPPLFLSSLNLHRVKYFEIYF